jgi:hypothetical protein
VDCVEISGVFMPWAEAYGLMSRMLSHDQVLRYGRDRKPVYPVDTGVMVDSYS